MGSGRLRRRGPKTVPRIRSQAMSAIRIRRFGSLNTPHSLLYSESSTRSSSIGMARATSGIAEWGVRRVNGAHEEWREVLPAPSCSSRNLG